MSARSVLAALAGLALAPGAPAGDRPLAGRSPFGGVASEGSPGSPVLELRGIMSGPDGMRYCVYDPSRHSSEWAAAEEAGHPFLVRSGDPALDAVTVEADGRVLVLRLREAKVLPAPPEPEATTPETAHAIMTRRQPGEPRAPRPKPAP